MRIRDRDDLPTAFRNAFAGDPLAAFGGIVALNRDVDRATAEAIVSIDKLLEVIVAPAFATDALARAIAWKNVRLLEVGRSSATARADASSTEPEACTRSSADISCRSAI